MAQSWKPEPKFFSADYHLGLEHYARYFEGARGQPVIGEKSVTYLTYRSAAERIGYDLPDVKIAFILRDPVERAFSHWRYTTENLLETLPLRDALIMEPWRAKRANRAMYAARPWSYFDSGRYAHHLAKYFERFPRERLHVIFTEELHADPAGISGELFSFLGIPPLSDAVALPQVVNDAARADMDEQTREFLQARFAPENLALEKLLQRTLPQSWRGRLTDLNEVLAERFRAS